MPVFAGDDSQLAFEKNIVREWNTSEHPVVSERGKQALKINPENWQHLQSSNFVLHFTNKGVAIRTAQEAEFYFGKVRESLELGANDMLRGLDPTLTERNVDAILSELGKRRIKVLVAGMRGAPNLDPGYVKRFEAIYPGLARRHGADLYPFFLEGVAAQPGMQQADGMHPTFAGVKRIVKGIAPQVEKALVD